MSDSTLPAADHNDITAENTNARPQLADVSPEVAAGSPQIAGDSPEVADLSPEAANPPPPFDRAKQVNHIHLLVNERKEWNVEEEMAAAAPRACSELVRV